MLEELGELAAPPDEDVRTIELPAAARQQRLGLGTPRVEPGTVSGWLVEARHLFGTS